MTTTNIQWTDEVWNCLRGCSRVSEGCRNCYAERQAWRFSGPSQPYEGLVKQIAVTKGEFKGNPPIAKVIREARWTGKVVFDEDKLLEPLHWKKPRRVFVNSMSDLFHEKVEFPWINKVFAVMALCPQHTFQVLTKRPKIMRDYFTNRSTYPAIEHHAENLTQKKKLDLQFPSKHIQLGVSVEDPDSAHERIPLLLQTPAAIRWVSYEPALQYVDFKQWLIRGLQIPMPAWSGDGVESRGEKLDWIVVGGESGLGARPFNLEWARLTVEDCVRAKVPVFVKQLGSKPFVSRTMKHESSGAGFKLSISSLEVDRTIELADRKGGDISEWPDYLKVRQYPE